MKNHYSTHRFSILDRIMFDTPLALVVGAFVAASGYFIYLISRIGIAFGDAILEAGHITHGLGMDNMVTTGCEPARALLEISALSTVTGFLAMHLFRIIHERGDHDDPMRIARVLTWIIGLPAAVAFAVLTFMTLMSALLAWGMLMLVAHWTYLVICALLLLIPFAAPFGTFALDD